MAPRHLPSPKTHAVVLVFAVCLFERPALGGQVDKAESRAEVSDDGTSGRIVNRTFQAILDDGDRAQILLRKEVQTSFRERSEGGPGRVRIDAWRFPRSSGNKPLYSIAERGDSIEWLFYPELLAVTIGACCASSGSYTVFNATTGKMLVYANGEGGEHGHLAVVKKERDFKFLIGVHDDHGGRWPSLSKDSKNLQLLVTTADLSGCRQQLFFEVPAPTDPKLKVRIDTYVTSVIWERHTAGKVSGLALELSGTEALDAALKAVISDGRVLLLPVSDDGIDSSKVTTPAGVKMTKVSPCRL